MTSSGVGERSFWTFALNTYKGNTLKWRAGAERAIRESVILRAGYSHEIQKGQDLLLPDDNAYRNRVWFSISYNFTRPLGR